MSAQDSVIRLVFEGQNAMDVSKVMPIRSNGNIKALDYDPVEDYIYWIQSRQNLIKRAHLNGTNVS